QGRHIVESIARINNLQDMLAPFLGMAADFHGAAIDQENARLRIILQEDDLALVKRSRNRGACQFDQRAIAHPRKILYTAPKFDEILFFALHATHCTDWRQALPIVAHSALCPAAMGW